MSNLEYIVQARKLLTEDYKTKHTNEYNSWLGNQQHSWMQPHVMVPFPPFIISAALAPFKPTVLPPGESEIVAMALELYNRANPPAPVVSAPVNSTEVDAIAQEIIPEPVVEVVEVVEEIIPEPQTEPVAEELAVEEPTVEESIVEEIQTKASAISYTDAIYKIYEIMKKESEVDNVPKFTSVDATLQTVPQPIEELAKVATTDKSPTLLEKLQSIWTPKGGSNV